MELEVKDRLTVLMCTNAAGMHKCKLVMISKSAHPHALKGVKVMPMIYLSNKHAWIMLELTTVWFDYHYVVAVWEH